MIAIDLSSLIKRPVEEVWTYLADPANATRWMTGVLEAVPISENPTAVGTKVRKVQRVLGWRTEMIYDIVEYQPNRKLAYKTTYGPLSYNGSISLESVETGTNLMYTGRGDLSSLFKLAEPIFARVAKKQFRNDFKTLKELLEARLKVASDRTLVNLLTLASFRSQLAQLAQPLDDRRDVLGAVPAIRNWSPQRPAALGRGEAAPMPVARPPRGRAVRSQASALPRRHPSS